MTYLTACETDVRAAASFYGGGIAAPQGPGGQPSTIGRSAKIKGRLLALFGGKDAFIPMDQVDAIRDALAQAKTRHEVVVYPDADHGFFCDQRATYQEKAAKDAWEKAKRLFREELGCTFREHVSNLRIERARRLLAETERSIVEVAGETGWSSLAHFNSAFRRWVGATPSAYRHRSRRDPADARLCSAR